MTATPSVNEQTAPPPTSSLPPWQVGMIDIFVRAANLIGLPRSIGEIYGLLYASAQPLNFDEIAEGLEISRGSVSQGLRLLKQLGAVKTHYIPGNRKDHYVPELSIEKLVRGFMNDQVSPHLESGTSRLLVIEELLADEADPIRRQHALQRLHTLQSWHRRAAKLLPLVLTVLAGAKGLSEPSDDIGSTIV
jgi:DNA-binding transcriptional regulator GbsR (MarR family)